MQKFFINMVSFGLWYFWDIIQIAYDSKRVRDEGLTGPFDWIRGIGRGVFIDPVKKVADDKDPGAKVVRTKKDIVIYALLTIFFGWMGVDKLYLGLPWQGLTKLLTTVNIFTFLFGLLWVFYDMFNVLFFQSSVVHGEISAPLPYNLLFTVGLSGETLFMPEEVTKENLAKEAVAAKEAGWAGAVGINGSGGMLPGPPIDLQTFRFLYRELAVPLLQPTVGTGVQKVDQGVKLTEKAVAVGSEVASTAPKIAGAVTTQMAAATDPNKLMGQIQAAAADKAAGRVGGQAGGGTGSGGSGPIIAGTLTAVVLAGAVKVISELLSDKKR
jgi:TM2 domain-containing membrane protein YozV